MTFLLVFCIIYSIILKGCYYDENSKERLIRFIRFLVVLFYLALFATNVSAGSDHQVWQRGSNSILGVTRDNIEWKWDSSKITGASAYQTNSGIFTRNVSIKKEGTSTSTSYRYLCKNKFLAGFSFGSQTLGLEKIIADRSVVNRGGKYTRYWDVG